MRYLKYVSIIFLAILSASSCSKKTFPQNTGEYGIAKVGSDVRKYNMNMNFGKKHFNGMIAIRQMDSEEIRVIGYTAFGLSLFDLGLTDSTFTVYNCIEPMQNKRLLNILERDFKLLFLPKRDVKKIETKDDYIKFADGKFLTKSVITVANDTTTNLQNILVKHPWLKLSIELHELNDGNASK